MNQLMNFLIHYSFLYCSLLVDYYQ